MIKRKKFALSFISILCNIKVTVASYYAYSGLTHDQLFLSHDKYCDFFYRLEKCPDGLVFNSKTRVCDLPTKTNCDGRTISNLVLSTTNAPLIVSEDDVRITDTISTEFNNDFPTDIEKSSTEIDEVGKWIYDGAKCYPVKRCPSIDPLDSTIFIPHHSDCSLFCGCKYGSAFLYRCQNGLHFNAKTLKCDFPDRVRCMKGSISQSTTRIIQESVTDTEISRTSTPSAVQGNPQYNQNGVGKWTFEGGKCHPKKRCPLIDSFDHIQFIPHRSNCSLFCGCKEGTALLYSCLPGFFFNPNKSECDFPEIAGCIEEKPIQKSTTGATKSVTESVNLLLSTQNSRIEYHPQYEDGVGKWTYEGGKCLPKKLCPSIDPLDSITFIAHRSNCSLFCGCKNGLPYVYSCLPGFHFNERTSKCDFPYLVGCEQENIDEGNNFVETETDVGSTLSFSSEYSTQENLHVTVSMSTESITDTTSSEISTQSYEVESSSVSENGSRKWTYDGSKCVPIKECPLIDPVASVTFIAHRSNCSQFCGCKDGSAFLYNCLPGLHFNPTFAECDLPNIAGCKSNKYETTVTKPETNTPIYTYTSSSTSAMEVEDAMVPVDGIKIGGKCLPVKRCPSIDFTDTNTFIAHRLHCNYFCECKLGSAILYRCPPGYHFNPNISKCDFPERAACIPRMFPTFTTLNPTTQLIDDIKTTTLANVPKSTNEFQPHSEQLPVEGIEIGGKCLPKRRCPLIDLFDSITFVEHRSDCSIFCRCIEGTAILYHCPTGYHFNPLISKCDLPERANCKGSKISDERTFKPTRVTTTSTSNPNIFPSSTDKVQFRDEVLPVQGIKVGGKCFPRRKCPLIDLLDSITFVAHRSNCNLFCECIDGNAILYRCPTGYHFNPNISKCDLPERASCNAGKIPISRTFIPTTRVTDSTISPSGIPNHTDEFQQYGKFVPVEGIKIGGKCLPIKRCPLIDLFDSIAFIAYRSNCSLFCGCIKGNAVLYRCPTGYHFNPTISKCDLPERADCIEGKRPDFTMLNPTPVAITTTTSSILATVASLNDEFQSNWDLLPVDGIKIGKKCLPKRKCPLIDLFDSITFVAHRSDCSLFCRCIDGTAILYRCPTGYYFNPTISKCDLPKRANCKINDFTTLNQINSVAITTTTSFSLPTIPSPTDGFQSHAEVLPVDGIEIGGKCLPKRRCPLIDLFDSITFIAHRSDCSLFCRCIDETTILYSCPTGYHFNPIISKCDLPERANCIEGKIPDFTALNATTLPPFTTTISSILPTVPTPTDGFQSYGELLPVDGIEIGGKCLPKRRCPLIDLFDSKTFVAHRSDCSLFCRCIDGTAILYRCPTGYHFNAAISKCDLPERASCSTGKISDVRTFEPIVKFTTSSFSTVPSPTDRIKSNEKMLPVNGIKVGGKCLPMRRCPVIDLFDSITFVAHRSDCSLFCGCIDGNAVLYRCPSGYHFNPIISKCDHPERADCIQPKFLDFTTRNPTTLFPITAMSAIPAVVPSPTDGFLSHEELLPVNGIEIGGKCLPKRRCPLIDLFDSIKFVAHRSNCSLFCRCINGAAILYSCPTGYHFNAAISKCDLPERASCNGSKFSDVRIFKPTMKATTSSISTVPSYTNGYQSHEEILSRNGIKLGGKCLPKRRCPLIDQLDSITFVAHRTNCSLFCGCIDGTAILYRCPAGYHFNQITSKCDLPERVDCIEGKFPDGTTFNPTMTVTRANTPIPSTTPSSSEEFKFHDGVPMNGVKVGGKCLPIRRCPSIDLFDSITFIAHRSNCSLFCGCTDGTAILYRCPHGYHFNPTISKCDYPHRANCEKPGGTHSPREHTATFPVPKTTEQNIVPSDQIVLAEGKMLGDILCKPIRRCPSIDPLDSIIVIAHRSDCSKYCRCKNGTAIPYQCPLGLHFNPKNGKCDLPSKSECKYSSSNELTTPRTITTTVNFLDSDIEKDKNVQFIGVECLPLGKCPIFHPKGVTIYLPHLKNCDHFCGCKEGKALLYRCRGGLHFNRYLSKCDVPSHANCTITDKGNILVTTIEPTEKIPGLTTSGKEQIISESFFVGGKCPTPKACPLSDSLDTKLFLPHSSKCNYFCGCSEGIPLLYLCPANLHFNPKLKICDLPSYANCTSENKSSTEESESSKGCPSCPKTNISESTIYFPHSTNCKYFCRCDHGVAVLHSCADDLFFNPELRACDLSVNFECKTPTMTSVQDTGSVSGVALRPSGSKDRTGAERLCPAVGICPKSYYSTQKTLLPHRSNCSLYCECLEGVPRIRQCGHGLHFNAAAASCDRPSQARCQGDCAKLTHTKGSTWEPATCLQSLSKLEDVCNISCISGYELKGSNSVTCTANGWNSTAGLNLLPTCKAPEELAIEVVEEVSSEIPRRNVDFLFMLDESRSVQEKGFAVEISFVKAVVTAFPLSRNRSAGVMRFSGVPHMDIKMGHSDTCHFLSDIEKIKYVGGRSDINAALQLAIREIQNNTNRKTLIFLITDGRSEIDPTPLTKMLKDQGSIIFIVGLGLYDRSQLETMASVGKDGEPLFYGLTNFQVVKKIADYINTVNGQGVRLNCPKNSHHKD